MKTTPTVSNYKYEMDPVEGDFLVSSSELARGIEFDSGKRKLTRTFKRLYSKLASSKKIQALIRYLFNCSSYADIAPRAVMKRLGFVVTYLIVFFVALSFPIGRAMDWSFREGYPMTMLSVFFLFVIGHFCLKIRETFDIRSSAAALWKVLGVTFIFLAFDDWLRIHETTDNLVHKLFQARPTDFTDHLDDVIVGSYAIIVAVIIWRGRKVLRQFYPARGYLLAAAVFSAGHCILDFVVSCRSWFRTYVPDPQALETLIVSGEVIEEACKLYAEVFLVATIVCCYSLVRSVKTQQPKINETFQL